MTMKLFDKQSLKNLLGKYVKEDKLDLILNGSIALQSLEKKPIGYILIFLKDNDPQSFQNDLNRLIKIIYEHHGVIDTISGSFISVLLGMPLPIPDLTEKRKQLVEIFSQELGLSIALLHGEIECLVGNIGNNSHWSYTALIPDFKKKLNILSSLAYGEITEN
jgi:hypothetical protein